MRWCLAIAALVATSCSAPAPPPAHAADACDVLASCARGCGEHVEDACQALTVPARYGIDPAAASTALRAGCDRGEPSACLDLADARDDDARALTDRAVALLQARCDRHEGPACNLLGALYADGTHVTLDRSRARALFQAGCDAGLARACTNLGNSARGHCDLDGARRALRRGCDLGDHVACDEVDAPRVYCGAGETDCTCPRSSETP
jgi:TPR repeat protein